MHLHVYGRISQARCSWLRSLGRLGADMQAGVYLVGGPVRDLILCRSTLDTDIAVEGDAHAYARTLADRDKAELTLHEAFGTAVLRYADGRHLDVAQTRSETYPRSGALPEVSPADIRQDLKRRDFTINAMAMDLRPGSFGELVDPFEGYAHLREGTLAALHEASFRDDPTRVLRAARFCSRFTLDPTPDTIAWLTSSVEGGCMASVSPQRLLTELWYLLQDHYPRGALELLEQWGAHSYLDLPEGVAGRIRPVDSLPVARRKLGDGSEDALEAAARAALALCFDTPQRAEAWTQVWPVQAERAEAVKQTCSVRHQPPEAVFSNHPRNSTLYAALDGLYRAAVLALWVSGGRQIRANLEHFVRHLQPIRADITGKDLVALGYLPGPEFKEALQKALEAKLDSCADRDQQLQAARRVLDRNC